MRGLRIFRLRHCGAYYLWPSRVPRRKFATQSRKDVDFYNFLNSIRDHPQPSKVIPGLQLSASHLRTLIDEYRALLEESKELDAMLQGNSDKELKAMVDEDSQELVQKIGIIRSELISELVKPPGYNVKSIMLEITSGAGGQEAMLFAKELFEMYHRFALRNGWQFFVTDESATDIGGMRRISARVAGDSMYRLMRFESGVHRVQRVPKTEKGGRIHTSTVAIAVLPEPDDIEIDLNMKDLKVETHRSQGAGGQHVNTTDSAVRMTHLPSGIVVDCQTQRSQHMNRAEAMRILRSRLFQQKVDEQIKATSSARKIQMGTRERSEKVRTYNFPQDRITDHRVPGLTRHGITEFLEGGDLLADVIAQLALADQEEQFQALLRRKVN